VAFHVAQAVRVSIRTRFSGVATIGGTIALTRRCPINRSRGSFLSAVLRGFTLLGSYPSNVNRSTDDG